LNSKQNITEKRVFFYFLSVSQSIPGPKEAHMTPQNGLSDVTSDDFPFFNNNQNQLTKRGFESGELTIQETVIWDCLKKSFHAVSMRSIRSSWKDLFGGLPHFFRVQLQGESFFSLGQNTYFYKMIRQYQ